MKTNATRDYRAECAVLHFLRCRLMNELQRWLALLSKSTKHTQICVVFPSLQCIVHERVTCYNTFFSSCCPASSLHHATNATLCCCCGVASFRFLCVHWQPDRVLVCASHCGLYWIVSLQHSARARTAQSTKSTFCLFRYVAVHVLVL